ncbi:zinc finger protein 675-like [Culex pipiens pallens]|uniref:zinc finger protein 675-like n=1 Tax=Culex pipiens pallens TaxID=42434 RepID=UPI001952C77C|nr:zinc finger protein 675-like [Culex pipiens pallens]
MQTELSDCFTCCRRTDTFLRICDESNTENVDQILARHFWFKRSDYEQSVLCTSCWEKIDEFHKFYCEVANTHRADVLLQGDQVIQVKEEEIDEESDEISAEEDTLEEPSSTRGRKRKKSPLEDEEFEAPVDVKLEEVPEEFDSEQIDVEQPKLEVGLGDEQSSSDSDEETDEEEDDSGSESSRPIAARKRKASQARRRGQQAKGSYSAEKESLIRKHFPRLPCDQCPEQWPNFKQLTKHARREHDSLPTVVCCKQSYQKQIFLFYHLLKHKFYCKECDRCYKTVDSFAMHNMLNHTPEEEKRFRCHLCETAFVSEPLLTSHLNWHATVEPKNIVCQKCNKFFSNTRMLEEHTTTHHPESLAPDGVGYPANVDGTAFFEQQSTLDHPADNTTVKKSHEGKQNRRKTPQDHAREDELIRKYCALNCEQCDYTAETFNQLELHYKHAHDERGGYATCCARKFTKKSRLYEHVCVHENPQHFKCAICAKTFLNSFGLSNHMMWKHTPDSEKPFRCDVCGSRFWKDYLLKQHMEYHLALEEKKFACKECNRFFGTNLLLKSHEQSTHGLSASWVCDVCAKGFAMKSALEFHRQQHSQEGRAALKAQCEHCKIWLKNIKSLRSHVKRCKSEPVPCDVCGKECSNAMSLRSHKKFVHTNATTYSCSFCAKPFKRLLRLKEHEAGHTGELLYKCEYCPRTCNSSSNMYTHKKVAHPEQWAEKMSQRHQR